MTPTVNIEELRDIEKKKMQNYLERLSVALKNRKIEKLDFLLPTELLELKEVLTAQQLGIVPLRIYENLVIFYFGRLYEIFDFEDIIFSTGEYPDAQATISGKKVRIEFKVTSRQFNYDPSGCDLVVCWEHNQPNIPLEVLQLKPLVEFIWQMAERKIASTPL